MIQQPGSQPGLLSMKIVLEYTIPDDQYDMWCAYNARHLYTAITEIEQHIREVHKYDADPLKALDRIQGSIAEMYSIAGQPLNG